MTNKSANNKFDLINIVLISTLKSDDKNLLVELIMRSDKDWLSWPSVERLCKVRGIKHEKNFKGVDVYLPGLVTKVKQGRKNFYRLNTPAIAGLSEFSVTIKHTPALFNTPALEGVNTPAVAENTPAVAENTPAVEGANSSLNNSLDTTRDSSLCAPTAAVEIQGEKIVIKDFGLTLSSLATSIEVMPIEEFNREIAAETAALATGSDLEPKTDVSPVIEEVEQTRKLTSRELEEVERIFDGAVTDGEDTWVLDAGQQRQVDAWMAEIQERGLLRGTSAVKVAQRMVQGYVHSEVAA